MEKLSTGQSAAVVVAVLVSAYIVISLLALGVWKFVELVS